MPDTARRATGDPLKDMTMGSNVFVTREIPEAGLEIVHANCDPVEMNPDDRVLTRA